MSRQVIAALLLGACAIFGCQPARGPEATKFQVEEGTRDAKRQTVSVLMPPDEKVLPLVQQLRAELGGDFNVQVATLESGKSTTDDIARIVAREHPKLVVLLNNPTARLYRDWARGQASPPVSIILMASFAEELQRTIPNATGISYEVPAVTTIVGMRGLGLRVDRVGVIYRKSFARYIQKQQELAAVEKVTFVSEALDEDLVARDLKASIVRLRRASVDALWIPNDNRLLSPEFITGVWLPYLKRFPKPVIVGVPSLVRGDRQLGTYAATPDIEALGIQAADLVFDISDGGWKLSGQDTVRLPVSVKTYLAPQVAQKLGIEKSKWSQIDFVVGASSAGN